MFRPFGESTKLLSFSKLSTSFIVLALFLGLNSFYVSLNSKATSLRGFSSLQSVERLFVAPQHGKKCTILAMMSHPDEFSVRKWHREQLRLHQLDLSPKERGIIRLQFAIPTRAASLQTRSRLQFESQLLGDLILMDSQDASDFTTGQNFEMFQRVSPLLDGACENPFLVRAESSYILNYNTLQAIVTHSWMPSRSAYFGSLVKDFPTPYREERTAGSFSQTFFPLFAYGGVYGMSNDMVKNLLQSKVMRTVLDPGTHFEFPSQDRALGLAFYRDQKLVRNPVYVNGLHHFCSRTDIRQQCHNYDRYLAFAVTRDGSSDKTKLKMLDETLSGLQECVSKNSTEEGYRASDLFFRVSQSSSKFDTTTLLTSSCAVLTEEGKAFEKDLAERNTAAVAQVSEDNSCAEQIYHVSHPYIIPLIPGIFKSGRDHYVAEGYTGAGNNYFCPDFCVGRSSIAECLGDCDKNSIYLDKNPDVRAVVEAGHFSSGVEHYEQHGRAEGRDFNCFKKFHPSSLSDNSGSCEKTWEKFINSTQSFVKKNWPLHGDPSDQTGAEQCKTLLMVATNDNPWMEYVLRVHRRYLGSDWLFQLVGPQGLADKWSKTLAGPMVSIASIPAHLAAGSLDDLHRSKWLWEDTVKCENVIHTTPDVLQLRAGVEDFFEYVYAGSPVAPETFPSKEWSRHCVNNTRCGGEGGFSFRRRSLSLKAIKECQVEYDDGKHTEDLWFTKCMADMGFKQRMPHPTISNRLSMGNKCEVDNPVGIHRTWEHCGASTCAEAIGSSVLYRDLYGNHASDEACEEGEFAYRHMYPDVSTPLPLNGGNTPGWDHFTKVGKQQGRVYPCFDPLQP